MNEREHVALTTCFYCGEADKILLATRYRRDGEPVHDLGPLNGKVVDMEPCAKCQELMAKGIILITIDPGKSEDGWNVPPPDEKVYKNGRWQNPRDGWMPDPWRTGGFFVITEEAMCRIFDDEHRDHALKHRWMFIEHRAAEMLGLFAAHEEAS